MPFRWKENSLLWEPYWKHRQNVWAKLVNVKAGSACGSYCVLKVEPVTDNTSDLQIFSSQCTVEANLYPHFHKREKKSKLVATSYVVFGNFWFKISTRGRAFETQGDSWCFLVLPGQFVKLAMVSSCHILSNSLFNNQFHNVTLHTLPATARVVSLLQSTGSYIHRLFVRP